MHQATFTRAFMVSLHHEFYPLFLVMTIVFLRIVKLTLEIVLQAVLRFELSLYECFLIATSAAKRPDDSPHSIPELRRSKLGVTSNFPERSFEKIGPLQSRLAPRVRRKFLYGRSWYHKMRQFPRARLLRHSARQSYFENFPFSRSVRKNVTPTRVFTRGDVSRIQTAKCDWTDSGNATEIHGRDYVAGIIRDQYKLHASHPRQKQPKTPKTSTSKISTINTLYIGNMVLNVQN